MNASVGKRGRSAGPVAVSRLTLTIVLANLVGLVILLVGSFGVTAYRDGLIEAKLQGVRAQSQIIADVLAQTAIAEGACEPLTESDDGLCGPALNEEDVKLVFLRVWDSFEGRVRIFRAPPNFEKLPVEDAETLLLEDVVLWEDSVIVEPLPPVENVSPDRAVWSVAKAFQDILQGLLTGGFRRDAATRTIEQELNAALSSSPFLNERGSSSVRINENGELVASVSVPIRQVQAIHGVVTSEIGGIDDLVSEARLAILPFFGLAAAAAIISSLLLTAAIAQPIRQLALASDKIREGISMAGRARLPDFSDRKDEIGELSKALRAMTQALYARIEAIESFAADVSHELKNPLTSIRSATETLEIAQKPEARDKLMGVIKNDVVRMDRLITDISNASRLDAELAREAREAIDVRKLVADIVDSYEVLADEGAKRVVFDPSGAPVYMFGNASALSQVFRNLIDNALSFSPEGGKVHVALHESDAQSNKLRVTVDDQGPGIPNEALDKIFTRFYTKRPKGAAFGNNSGLGLAISKQIANSHLGDVHAENRPEGGARFVVTLPRA